MRVIGLAARAARCLEGQVLPGRNHLPRGRRLPPACSRAPSPRAAVTAVAAVAAVAALLSACTPVQPYVPPTHGDTARLLLRPTTPANMSFALYAYDDAHACRAPARVMTGNASTGHQSSTLRAGPLATLSYVGVDGRRSCRVIFSFYPKANHTYLLAMSQDGMRCAVNVLDASDGDNPRPERSLIARTARAGGCDPVNKNARADEAIKSTYDGATPDSGQRAANSLDDFNDLLPK